MAKRNPTASKDSLDLDTVFPGIDHLPNPMGISQENLREANEFPGHGAVSGSMSYTPNDGDQKDVATPEFANGKDVRSYRQTGSSPAAPARTGANV